MLGARVGRVAAGVNVTRIAYRAGYKYQLAEDYSVQLDFAPAADIKDDFLEFNPIGVLTVRMGYAWDGPSGPTIDTPNFMRGSLVHDALYQLMRERRLDQAHRKAADETLRRICREDGMSQIRAWWVYQGVRLGGGPSANPANDKPVLWAPTMETTT